MSMILGANARRYRFLVLGVAAAIAIQVTGAPNAGRVDEPWPMLLSGDTVSLDPGIAMLQERANGSLERLVQSARAQEQPL